MALHTAVARSEVTFNDAIKITQTITKEYFLQTGMFIKLLTIQQLISLLKSNIFKAIW